MNKILFYIAMILNLIVFSFFLFSITIGIGDELSPEMLEKTRLFFALKKLDVYLLSVFGVILPFINMYFLLKFKMKS